MGLWCCWCCGKVANPYCRCDFTLLKPFGEMPLKAFCYTHKKSIEVESMNCLGCGRALRNEMELGYGLHKPSCEDAGPKAPVPIPPAGSRLYEHYLRRQRDLRKKETVNLGQKVLKCEAA